MITYKWTFPSFECILDENGLEKIVTMVHWRYSGTDEDEISFEAYGSITVGEPNPDAFTPYPDLSEEQVIGWMEDNMDVEQLQSDIANQINLIKNPVKQTFTAPWNTVE